MLEIQSTVLALLPPKRKTTPSGWTSFNAVCCHHKGEKPDTRGRGGIRTDADGSWQYHCFNCNFKAGWSPGKLLSTNTKQLLSWLGLNDFDINKLVLLTLKNQDTDKKSQKIIHLDIKERELPEDSMKLVEWANQEVPKEIYQNLLDIFDYLNYRGMNIDWYPWYWTPSAGYKDRVIIPFYQHEKIVGYTARKISDGKPKYLTDSQPGYVFNIDRQTLDKQYCILVEGQFDAISIDGCAIGHNEPNDTQILRINNLGKEVIVVPDKDRAGAKLLNSAIANGWSVSLPPWEDDIKDVADSVKRYGRLYTLNTILHYKEQSKIKIELLKKKLEKING